MIAARTQFSVYRTKDEFDQKAAEKIVRVVLASIRERKTCSIALSGGETPRGVYRRLGLKPLRDRVDWSRVQLFFSDERVVPPADPQSNFGMVERELLSHIKIPDKNVHRIKGEMDPGRAAVEYEKDLKEILGGEGTRFDLILLGLGDDGHTASLFPGVVGNDAKGSFVASVDIPHLRSSRVTLTLRCINSARTIMFLVAGKQKASIVQRVLGTKGPTKDLPATLVRPTDGKSMWLLDQEAGAMLVSTDDAG